MTTATTPTSIEIDAVTLTAAIAAVRASGEGLLPIVPPVEDPGALLGAAGWLRDGRIHAGLLAALSRLRAPSAVVRVVTLDPGVMRTSRYDVAVAPDGYLAVNVGEQGLRAVVLDTAVEAAAFLTDTAAVLGPAAPPSDESLVLPHAALATLATIADLRREERMRAELARDQTREIAVDAATLTAVARRLTTVDLRWSVPVLGAVAPTQLFVDDWAEAGIAALIGQGILEPAANGAAVTERGAALAESLARLVKATTLTRLLALDGSLAHSGALSVLRTIDRVLVVVWADPDAGTLRLYDAGLEGASAALRAFLARPEVAEAPPVDAEVTPAVAAAQRRATVDEPTDVWDLSGADAVVAQLEPATAYEALEERDGWLRVRSPDGAVHGWVDAAAVRVGESDE